MEVQEIYGVVDVVISQLKVNRIKKNNLTTQLTVWFLFKLHAQLFSLTLGLHIYLIKIIPTLNTFEIDVLRS